MKKNLGIFLILVSIMLITFLIGWLKEGETSFLEGGNLTVLLKRTSLFGVLSIGVAFVIITGGIDLSIGSVVGLTGVLLPFFITPPDNGGMDMPVPLALFLIFIISLSIGLTHGLLITKLKLQPFVVTLCGLFVYRGISRVVTKDANQGFGIGFKGIKSMAKGKFQVGPESWEFFLPAPFLILIVIGIIAAIYLNLTVYGRYLLALGRNEIAARFSGIKTDNMTISAYVFSSLLAGFGGILWACDVGSIQPSGFGNFYELYAIAGAVLGGCSLRGGEGTILGVIFGSAILVCLQNAINILGISSQLEFAVIGLAILIGVIVDEVIKRVAAKRRAIQNALQAKLESG